MEIKASDVKALREKTGAGMMECKKALMNNNGDAALAEKELKEKGLAAVAKRSDRATGEGRIFVKSSDKKITMIEVTCETDFVAKNADFVALGEKLCEVAFEQSLNEVTQELKDMLEVLAIKIRENMSVKRVVTVEVPANAVASSYVHHNFKLGSVVLISGSEDASVKDFAHECCLHLAANTPAYITKDEVPAEYVAEQKEIFVKQMEEDAAVMAKPENVRAGILNGKINKHLAEICFMDQKFISDEKKTVTAKLAETGKGLKFEKVVLYVLGK